MRTSFGWRFYRQTDWLTHYTLQRYGNIGCTSPRIMHPRRPKISQLCRARPFKTHLGVRHTHTPSHPFTLLLQTSDCSSHHHVYLARPYIYGPSTLLSWCLRLRAGLTGYLLWLSGGQDHLRRLTTSFGVVAAKSLVFGASCGCWWPRVSSCPYAWSTTLQRYFRLHRMHEMQTIVTDVRGVCLLVYLSVCPSICLSVTRLNSASLRKNGWTDQDPICGKHSWAQETLC